MNFTDGLYMNTMCASDSKDFTFVKFTSQLFSLVLKRRNASATALRWFVSDMAHIVLIYVPSVVKPVHIFMVRNRVSKSCLMVELCYQHFVHFDCVPIYIFGFNHKQCASN